MDCSDDADACPPGSICWPFENASQCVPALGDCSVPPRCRAASDCPPGNTCDDGVCQARCQSDTDCPAQWRCLDGLCRAPARCETDQECPQGTICQSARCLPGCSDNSGCPLGETCQSGRCEQGCDEHADCPLDRLPSGSMSMRSAPETTAPWRVRWTFFLPGTALRSQARPL